MIRVHEFMCDNKHRTEHFVEPGTVTVTCPVCCKAAHKVISAPRVQLEGVTGSFPGASIAWQRKREQKMAQERKHKAENGTYRSDGAWEKMRGVEPGE